MVTLALQEKSFNHEGHEVSRKNPLCGFPLCYFVSFVVKGFKLTLCLVPCVRDDGCASCVECCAELSNHNLDFSGGNLEK